MQCAFAVPVGPAKFPLPDSTFSSESGKLIRDTREKLGLSRAVFARKLRINVRTLEKWEQGDARANAQAATLILLVRRFPDTLERLERIARSKH
jgi:DNA-binding transcriptional regulator YiaG